MARGRTLSVQNCSSRRLRQAWARRAWQGRADTHRGGYERPWARWQKQAATVGRSDARRTHSPATMQARQREDFACQMIQAGA
jgi:hypothetical protein